MNQLRHPYQEDVLARLVEAVSCLEDGVALLSPDWTVDYINGAMCALFELRAPEVLGRLVDKSIFGKIDRDLGNGIGAIVERNGSWRGRLSVTGSDGAEKHLQISVSAVPEDGGYSGRRNFVVIARDVTDERHREVQLELARKMEAVGTMAGGIAHEFNNILAAVIGFAELAEMDAQENSELAENIKEILIAGKRARDLVRQILAFSRQDDGLSRSFNLKPIVSEALKMLRASLPTSIEIRRSIKSTSAIVGDPAEVHQVLMQLCTNALMAMRGGGVLGVELQDKEVDPAFAAKVQGLMPGSYITLSISDTGIGMSQKLKERVFDPFFTTRQEGEGRGLGLSVVHGIVKRAGGTIDVYSEPGRGSVFTVYWPRVYEDGNGEPEAEGALPNGDERILFVDDEEMLVTLARKNLKEMGYDVTALGCPVEALDVFRQNPDGFDLVVTDVTMPGMSGVELAKELRTLRPDLPIIMCTGYSRFAGGENARSFGVSALAAKPLVIRDMAALIRKVLSEGPGGGGETGQAAGKEDT